MCLEIDFEWFGAKLTPLLYTSRHFFVTYFENFRHWFPPGGMASAPELLSWIANWSYQKKNEYFARCWSFCDVAGGAMARKFRKNIEKVEIFVIFHQFWWGPVGVRSRDMNIYNFWIDLDGGNSKFQKYWMVSRTPGTQVRKYDSGPTGVRAGVGLQTVWPAGAEQKSRKSKKRTNAKAASVQMCGIVIFSGSFNWRRNYDEIDPKITMKSRIWTFEIGSNVRELTLASR